MSDPLPSSYFATCYSYPVLSSLDMAHMYVNTPACLSLMHDADVSSFAPQVSAFIRSNYIAELYRPNVQAADMTSFVDDCSCDRIDKLFRTDLSPHKATDERGFFQNYVSKTVIFRIGHDDEDDWRMLIQIPHFAGDKHQPQQQAKRSRLCTAIEIKVCVASQLAAHLRPATTKASMYTFSAVVDEICDRRGITAAIDEALANYLAESTLLDSATRVGVHERGVNAVVKEILRVEPSFPLDQAILRAKARVRSELAQTMSDRTRT